jgi:putative transposase
LPKSARIVIPGCPHHVLNRGNHKENIFGDDSDRLVYLRLMRDASVKYHTFIWTYTLMDNHVHHIVVPEREDSLARTFKEAHGEYTSYFNFKYGFVGHAWQERFRSVPMDQSHCRNAIRYVERNPVRAGMVEFAEDYLWSSAAAHCGLRDDMLLSGDCPLTAEIGNWSEWLAEIPDSRIEDLIRQHTRTGKALGSNEFLIQAGIRIGRNLLPRKRGPRSTSRRGDIDDANQPPSTRLFG